MARSLILILALGILVSTDLVAQSTATPVYVAPYRQFNTYEIGASLTDPGSAWTLEGFYRFGHDNFDIGIRSGMWSPDNGDTRFLIGVDLRTRVVTHSDNFPLDGALTLGLGGNLGGGTDEGYIPIGISLGRKIVLENSAISFSPFVQPVLTPSFGTSGDLLFTLGLGADIKFTKHFGVNVSGGIGDVDGVGISASYIH